MSEEKPVLNREPALQGFQMRFPKARLPFFLDPNQAVTVASGGSRSRSHGCANEVLILIVVRAPTSNPVVDCLENVWIFMTYATVKENSRVSSRSGFESDSMSATIREKPPDIRAISNRIVEQFRPRRIILFGSHALGNAGHDSDLDLFVEMESELRPPERAAEVSALFGLRSWPLDVVVYTPKEVERLRGIRGTLLARIEEEGRILYEGP